jgi:hypothetical protein
MPVVFREGGLRYFFYSNEGMPREPHHVHVKGMGCDARFGLSPRFPSRKATASTHVSFPLILRIVANRRDQILKAWHDHFGNGSPL